MKIMEEVAPIDIEQSVKVNGDDVKIGKGNHHIIHLSINDKSSARVSFFARTDENVKAIEEMRTKYVKILCDLFVKPLSKLLTELNEHVAV